MNAQDQEQAVARLTIEAKNLQYRVGVLESILKTNSLGYICEGCAILRPRDWYWYTAHNTDSGENVAPLCADCIKGNGHGAYSSKPWNHGGPYHQPIKGVQADKSHPSAQAAAKIPKTHSTPAKEAAPKTEGSQ